MENKEMTDEKMKKVTCIAICQATEKIVLMQFDEKQGHWMCLHKDTREEELKEIKDFIKKHK